jgi:hypothetical protein
MKDTLRPVFSEKLYPSAAFLLGIQVLPVGFWLISLPIWPSAALYVALATEAVILALAVFRAPSIHYDGSMLVVGNARLERSAIGEIEIYRGESAQKARTNELDSRAWLNLRPGINTYVKVTLVDERDATPYWLFSSRNPEALAEALDC